MGILPVHVDHRAPPVSPALVPWLIGAPAKADAGVPLLERDLEPRDREALSDGDPMLRLLLRLLGRAHHELTRWHDYHLGAVGTFPEDLARPQDMLCLRGEHLWPDH